jgi:HEAT repeat protein
VDRQARTALPVLLKALGDDNERVRAHAAWCLGEIGPEAKEALEPLRQQLKEDDPPLRLYSAHALWRIGRQAKEAAPTLAAVWKEDPNPAVILQHQLDALRSLGEMGREDKAVVETLVQLAGHHNRWVRQAAVEALKKADPKAAADAGIR